MVGGRLALAAVAAAVLVIAAGAALMTFARRDLVGA